MRILIVDDDPAAVQLITVRLKRWGYDFTVAGDGEQALAALADPSIRIVLSDWMMPGMSGVELCRRIREIAGRPYAYVILLTAKHQHEDLVHAFQAGADAFVCKPFQPRELQMRLEAAKRLIDQMSSDGARSGAAITPQPGDVVGGRYRLTSLLGAGAMGTVWEAEHMVLRSRVAVKFLRPEQASSEAIRARFETEARLGAQIASPYVVRVFDSGIAEGAPYLVMDLVRGRTLSDAVAQEGPKSPPEVARIVRQVASALMCAHAGGVIHRDVKPENVLLDGDASRPGGYTAKLIDFGVARVEDTGDAERPSARSHPQTEAGMILGTPHFMSPEYVTSCHADRALDVWGLAATAYFAMAGEVPFDGDTLWNIVAKVCHAPLPVPSQHNPRVPPGFDAWFAQACDRDPSRRFRDADELAVTLERVCAPLRAPVVLSRPSAPSRRPWKSVSAFALAMLGALVVLSACFSIH